MGAYSFMGCGALFSHDSETFSSLDVPFKKKKHHTFSSIWTGPADKQYTQPNQDIFPLEHSYQKYLPYLKIKSIAYITTQHRCYLQNDASPFWGGEVLCHWPVWHDTNELISCCANKIATDFNLYKKTSSDTYRI